MNRRSYAVLLVTLCGACSFKASCGDKNVKAAEVEADVKARVTALGLTPTKVDCDDKIEAKVGAAFTCKVAFANQEVFGLAVTITSVDEEAKRAMFDTRWVDGDAVVAPKVASLVGEDAAKRFGPGVELDCGETLRFMAADQTITCDVSAGAYRGKITVHFEGEGVIQDVKYEPSLLAKNILERILTPSVQAQTSAGVTVSCGDQVVFSRPPDGVVWCDITDGGQAAKIRVEINDDLSIERWAVAEPPT